MVGHQKEGRVFGIAVHTPVGPAINILQRRKRMVLHPYDDV